jgi:Flp pilus assembly CpaF family ATPase
LSAFIDHGERVITIEDSAELRLQQPHVGRLETRPANIEDRGVVTQRELVKNALRMRPDRIIVGEARSGEAFDMLQAMNTGHDGSMTTVHANSPRDALSRLEQMIGMAGLEISPRSIRSQIASAIQVIVHLRDRRDGGGNHQHAGDFPLPSSRPQRRRGCRGRLRGDRHPPAFHRRLDGPRDPIAASPLRAGPASGLTPCSS